MGLEGTIYGPICAQNVTIYSPFLRKRDAIWSHFSWFRYIYGPNFEWFWDHIWSVFEVFGTIYGNFFLTIYIDTDIDIRRLFALRGQSVRGRERGMEALRAGSGAP